MSKSYGFAFNENVNYFHFSLFTFHFSLFTFHFSLENTEGGLIQQLINPRNALSTAHTRSDHTIFFTLTAHFIEKLN